MKYVGELLEGEDCTVSGARPKVVAWVEYACNEPETFWDRVAGGIRALADRIDGRCSIQMRFRCCPDIEDQTLEKMMDLAMRRFGDLVLQELRLRFVGRIFDHREI